MPSKKMTKEEERAAAAISKERLERITKTRRHHLRTNSRVLKYGTKSFVRNTWLSIAAMAIMAVTLIVLSATLIAAHAMSNVIDRIEQQVDMSVYIKQEATEDQITAMKKKISSLPTVLEVSSTSPDEANHEAIQKILENTPADKREIYRQSLLEAPNVLPWTLNIKLINLNNTQELEDFVANDESMKGMLDPNREPSYASGRRETIDNIAAIMRRVEMIGLIAAGVFALIAILVVFNTIRMAIFNRREEIYMMRLVGASRWFIVGPFVVEASLYGIVAAILAGAVVYAGTFAIKGFFNSTLDPTVQIMSQFWYVAFAMLILTGILIGVISSLLATRKYLKQK